MKSHKGVFFSSALFVTSSSPLQIEFIIKTMLGEKRFYILVQQILGNRACMYALACIYALCFKILGKL